MAGHVPVLIAIVASVLVGMAAGLINGIIITVLHVNSFIATLGTASAFTGVALIYSHSNTDFVTQGSFLRIGQGTFWGLAPETWILVVLMVGGGLLLAKTVYGRSIYAVGGNQEAARLAGMRVRALQASVFVIVGGCAALAGLITVAQVGTSQASMGSTMPLDTIAVVVIGGASLLGGEGGDVAYGGRPTDYRDAEQRIRDACGLPSRPVGHIRRDPRACDRSRLTGPEAEMNVTAPSALKFEGVTKSFGANHALRPLDMQVSVGTIHAFVGENGAASQPVLGSPRDAFLPVPARCAFSETFFVQVNRDMLASWV